MREDAEGYEHEEGGGDEQRGEPTAYDEAQPLQLGKLCDGRILRMSGRNHMGWADGSTAVNRWGGGVERSLG